MGEADRGNRGAADQVGEGLRWTWPQDGLVPGIVIDHVLVGPRVAVRAVSVHAVLGTDHRAVLAELTLPSEPSKICRVVMVVAGGRGYLTNGIL